MPSADEYAQWIVSNADKKGTADFEVVAKAYQDALKAKPAPQASVKAGAALNDIPRQLGLTARYGLEGVANAAQLVTEPLRYVTDALTPDRKPTLTSLVTGQTQPKSTPLGVQATKLADWIGLPTPQTADERVVGDATRLVAGTGATMGVGSLVKGGELTTKAGQFLTQNPVAQLSSAAGAGLAGGSSREAGGSTGGQILASVAGGLAGNAAVGLGQSLATQATGLKNKFVTSMTPQDMDVKISEVLQKAGVDYSQVPERLRQSLRTELASSLRTEQDLDPQAVARLLDFRRNGLTPTRGMLTLDPVQITREQNLAKVGANSADGQLQGLARIQNQNNSQLISGLNEQGAARGNMMGAGASSIGAIRGRDSAMQEAVSGLYGTARAMPGGNTQLDRTSVVNNIYSALGRENKLAFLPESVSNMLDTISKGVVRAGGQDHAVPFDANALDNLMTVISTAQRGTSDGNVKAALGIARKALEASPITPLKSAFDGNQLVTQPLAQAMKSADAEAPAFIDAIKQAKAAAAQRFGWQESGRPIEAALGGAQPDDFVRRFVISGTLKDARDVAGNAPSEPVRDAIVAHLKDKALNGAADEVGKFSQSAFNKEFKALRESGKLALFFKPEEIEQLSSMGRAASYLQHQPVGSAVNNSNSGALLLGRGLDLLDKVPVVGPMTGPALKNIQIAFGNRQAQNITPGLLAEQVRDPRLSGLIAPSMAIGGLLAAP